MSQIQPLQVDSGVAKAEAGWAAEPIAQPGQGPPCPALAPTSPCIAPALLGSSLRC